MLYFYRLLFHIVHFILAIRSFVFNCWDVWKTIIYSCGEYRKLTTVKIREDSKTLKKLPMHVGLVVLEDDISYTDLANIIVWCMAIGISYISVYDRAGICKKNGSLLKAVLQRQQSSILGAESSKFDVHIHQDSPIKKQQRDNCKRKDIYLVSVEDGRGHLVETSRQLCHAVASGQYEYQKIVPSNVDAILQEKRGCPDPDVVLRFGVVNSMLGFLPWQMRLTEIFSVGSHHQMDYRSFLRALETYAHTEQRYGK